MTVVRCSAPARTPRYDGQRCRKELLRAPTPMVVRPLKVRGVVRPGTFVMACRCGALYEIQYAAIDQPLETVA